PSGAGIIVPLLVANNPVPRSFVTAPAVHAFTRLNRKSNSRRILVGCLSKACLDVRAHALNRPGGNVTGVTIFGTDAVAKRTQLLREVAPKSRVKADMTFCGNPLSRSLLGVKRTWPVAVHMSAYDPKRTY